MKRLLFYTILVLIPAFFILSCSEDKEDLTDTLLSQDSTELSTRNLDPSVPSGCEGCEVDLVRDGCSLDAVPFNGCGEILSVQWTLEFPSGQIISIPSGGPGVPITMNHVGEYCITIVFGDECTVESCYNLTEACDPCDDCIVTIENDDCELSYEITPGCGEIISVEWTDSNGNVISTDDTIEVEEGEFCVTVLDFNDCIKEACITIDNCTTCEENDCVHYVLARSLSTSFTYFAGVEVTTCEPETTYTFCADDDVIFMNHNEYNCNNKDLANQLGLILDDVATFYDCIESQIQNIPGCESTELVADADVFSFHYCETCPIHTIRLLMKGNDTDPNCIIIPGTEQSGAFGGHGHCGYCF